MSGNFKIVIEYIPYYGKYGQHRALVFVRNRYLVLIMWRRVVHDPRRQFVNPTIFRKATVLQSEIPESNEVHIFLQLINAFNQNQQYVKHFLVMAIFNVSKDAKLQFVFPVMNCRRLPRIMEQFIHVTIKSMLTCRDLTQFLSSTQDHISFFEIF